MELLRIQNLEKTESKAETPELTVDLKDLVPHRH